MLSFTPPGGKFTLLHDRDWHTFTESTRLTVLKWLDHGEVVAQCNLAAGPDAGRGRHQDLGQFRDDIRRALGKNFGKVVGEGEVRGDPSGGFRHKVAVGGKVGEVGVLWLYYLVASPQGHQLLATFTLAENQSKRFADQDLRLVGSLRWHDPRGGPEMTRTRSRSCRFAALPGPLCCGGLIDGPPADEARRAAPSPTAEESGPRYKFVERYADPKEDRQPPRGDRRVSGCLPALPRPSRPTRPRGTPSRIEYVAGGDLRRAPGHAQRRRGSARFRAS